MQCTICSSQVSYIDGMFVCKEGHISGHSMEISEIGGALRSASLRKKDFLSKKHLAKKKFDMKYGRIVVFTALFYESQKLFGLKTDLLLRLHVSLIKHRDKEILDDYKIISPYALHALIYLTKRTELESEYIPLLANEYMRYIRFFPYKRHLRFFYEKISNVSLKNSRMRMERCTDYLCLMYKALFSMNKIVSYTDISTEQMNAFESLVQLQKNDMKMFFMYLRQILDDFCVEMTPQLVFYFKKFVYTNNLDKTIFVPEIEICLFLYEYLSRFTVQVDYKEATSRICTRLTAFANEKLLTKELSKTIHKHRCANSTIDDVFLSAGNKGQYKSLKYFVSDYLGIRPYFFDKLRYKMLKKVNDTLDNIEYP
eukprot:jgi/Antlo1/838/1930